MNFRIVDTFTASLAKLTGDAVVKVFRVQYARRSPQRKDMTWH